MMVRCSEWGFEAKAAQGTAGLYGIAAALSLRPQIEASGSRGRPAKPRTAALTRCAGRRLHRVGMLKPQGGISILPGVSGSAGRMSGLLCPRFMSSGAISDQFPSCHVPPALLPPPPHPLAAATCVLNPFRQSSSPG